MFVAEVDGTAIGMAFGLLDREQTARAHLGGMWVAPEARQQGCGRALFDAVVAWARERGFTGLALWVTEGNKAAITLYERLGFTPTGRRDRLPHGLGLAILEMERSL
jgi:GNAT superfamily N-acetyltransferase